MGRFLHGGSQQIVGDDHHRHRFVGHSGRLHVEFLRIKEVGDDDEGGFFARSIFVSQLDVSQGDAFGESVPFGTDIKKLVMEIAWMERNPCGKSHQVHRLH